MIVFLIPVCVCSYLDLSFRSLAKYSSEEESDIDSRPAKKDKNKRATMAAPTSRVTLRKSVKKVENDSDSEVKIGFSYFFYRRNAYFILYL